MNDHCRAHLEGWVRWLTLVMVSGAWPASTCRNGVSCSITASNRAIISSWRARILGLGCHPAGRELRPSYRLPWTNSPGRLTAWLNCLSIWPGLATAGLTSRTRCSAAPPSSAPRDMASTLPGTGTGVIGRPCLTVTTDSTCSVRRGQIRGRYRIADNVHYVK